jgi:hypothetical protein
VQKVRGYSKIFLRTVVLPDQFLEFGIKGQHMSDHEQLPCLAGRLEHAVGFFGIERDSRFHEYVLAGLEIPRR